MASSLKSRIYVGEVVTMVTIETKEAVQLLKGNLPYKCKASELADFLKSMMNLDQNSIEVNIEMKPSGQSKGFGFITVTPGTEHSWLPCDGREFQGRKIKVQLAGMSKTSETKTTPHSKTTSHNIEHKFPLIDIGVNLTHRRFAGDLDDVVSQAQLVGVEKMVVTGTSLYHSKEALELTQKYPQSLYSTAGVHPHDAKQWTTDHLDQLEKLAVNPACVAIGECGLDFNRNFSPQQKQLEVFEKQVQLACRLRKPLFLHEREAHKELVTILNKYQAELPPVVIHCFTGNKTEVSTYIDLGFYIGLTGHVWKAKAGEEVRTILKSNTIPLDRLMLETDAPFMYPRTKNVPVPTRDNVDSLNHVIVEHEQLVTSLCRRGRNEPCSLVLVNDMVAACLGLTPEHVARTTTHNAKKVFGLT